MKTFDNIVLDDYIKTYYHLRLSEVRLMGETISEDSVVIVSDQYKSSTYIKEFLNEIQLIFGIDEDDLINKHINDWYYHEFYTIKISFDSTVSDIKRYFNTELTISLGPRDWLIRDKSGKVMSLDDITNVFYKMDIKWINKKIINRFYENWYNEEIIKVSERMMNF
jgi:hypothetical protein